LPELFSARLVPVSGKKDWLSAGASWKRLFISKFSPVDAAERAYAFWLNSQPTKFRTGLRRDISEASRAKQTPRERLQETLAKKR